MGGMCYPLAVTKARICAMAMAMARPAVPVSPYIVDQPIVLEIILNDGPYLQAIVQDYSSDMTDTRTLRLQGNNATEVWASYWCKKLRCQDRIIPTARK